MPRILLNPYRNNLSIDGITLRHDELLDQAVKTTSDVTFNSLQVGDITATGNITFTGNVTEIDSQHVLFQDNIIDINSGNINPLLTGGFQVQRGPGLVPFDVLYDEPSQLLRIGFDSTILQAVATREDSPEDGYIAVWNASLSRFDVRNTISQPFTFSGSVFSRNATFFGPLNGTGPSISGDYLGNLTLSVDGNLVLGSSSQTGGFVIVPTGKSLQFSNTSNIFADSFGNITLSTQRVNFLQESTLSWQGAASVSTQNAGNDMLIIGNNINLSPGSSIAINTNAPISHAGICTFQPLTGGIYEIASTGYLYLSGTEVVMPSMSLNRLVNFTTDVNGNLSVISAGDVFFSPATNFILNPNKNLCLGGNTSMYLTVASGNLVVNSNTGILLNATNGTFIPQKLTVGNYATIYETDDGTATFASSDDILLSPGASRSVSIPVNIPLTFAQGETLISNGSVLSISATSQILFSAPSGLKIPQNISLSFGDSSSRIFQDTSNNLNIDASQQIILNCSESVSILGNRLALASTLIYEDVDSSLTLYSGATANLVKTTGTFLAQSTALATNSGTGSLITNGGIFVGGNIIVTQQSNFRSAVNVANVVTIDNQPIPILINNSSASDGSAIGITTTWDYTAGYTIGRGSLASGGRSLAFTVPPVSTYGIGASPNFYFGTSSGQPYMTLDETGLNLSMGTLTVTNTSANALVVDGSISAQAMTLASALDAGGNSLAVTLSNVTINTQLNVANGLYVSADNFSEQLLSLDTTGTVFTLAATFNNRVNILGNSSINGSLLANGGITLGGNLDLQFNQIVNVPNPVNGTDIATKSYVDTFLQGFSQKEAVLAATTANIDISVAVYNVDGVSLITNDRLLVMNQSDETQNGIYTLDENNIPQRSDDMQVGSNASGSSVFVTSGTVNGGIGYVILGNPVIVGTNDIVITPFSGASQISAGGGLAKSGNVFSVDVDDFSISLNGSNNIQVNPSFISNIGLTGGSNGTPLATSPNQSHVTSLGTITSGNWNANVINVAYGGTGVTSIAAGMLVLGNGSSGITTTNKIFISPSNGFIGLQTTNPAANLHLIDTVNSTGGTWMRIEDVAQLTTQSSGLTINTTANNARIALKSNGTLYVGQEDYTNASMIAFATQQVARMTIDYAGNVLIGAGPQIPGNILTVIGQTYLNGTTTIKGDLVLPTLTITSDSLGNAIFNATTVKISSGFDVSSDATMGNFKFISSVVGQTSIISADRNTTLGLPLQLGTSSTNICAVCTNSGFLVPGNLQIGGTSVDISSGFSVYTQNNNLCFTPGTSGAKILFDSPLSCGSGISLYDISAPTDFVNLSVAQTYLTIKTNTTSPSPYTIQIGGGSNEIVTRFVNKANTAYVQYDPTNSTVYAGGVFSVSQSVLTSFASEVQLNDVLRFDLANSTEGVMENTGWYYLGVLGVGRTTMTASLSWRIRLDYDGVSQYVASVLNYDRNVASLVIYSSAGLYYLYLNVLSGPCRVSILESPTVFYLSQFEGGGATPDGQYSSFSSSWILDFNSSTSQSNAQLDFGSINVYGSSTLNGATLNGQTTLNGSLQVNGASSFIGSSLTLLDPVSSLPKVSLQTNSDGVSSNVIIYGASTTSPALVLNNGLDSANIGLIPVQPASLYSGALNISQNDNDASSQIVFSTRSIPALLIDSNGNTQILSQTDSVQTGVGSFTVNGGAIFQKRISVAQQIFVPELELLNSSAGTSVSLNCDENGSLDVQGSRISNVGNPVNLGDAVNMAFVQGLIQGLSTKDSVIAASAGQNYNVASIVTVVDGTTLNAGSRILLKDQANPVENGIYEIQSGEPPVRVSDLGVGYNAAATYVFVSQGVVNADSGWICSSVPGQDVVGVNALTYTQFSGAGQFTAGAGLTKNGNVVQVNVDGASLEIANNNIRVSSSIAGVGLTGGSGQPLTVSSIAHLATLGTIQTGVWNASPISMAYGGTGSTMFAVGRIPFSNGVSLTQGSLFFDSTNIRLGINTTSPVSGLTLQDRDIQINQTVATSSSIILSSAITNYTFAARNDGAKFYLSGGTGTNKTSLADMVSLDNAGNLSVNNNINTTSLTISNSTILSSTSIKSLQSGPFALSMYSLDNTGAYMNYYGGLGTSSNNVNSEFMKVGYYNANYIIATSASGLGVVRSLCLQAGSNTNQLLLQPNGNIVMNAPIYMNSTVDASSISSGGSLTIAGGMAVGATLFAGMVNVVSTSDNAIYVGGGITAAKTVVSGVQQNYSFSSDISGILNLGGSRTVTDSILQMSSKDANNTVNVFLRLFGLGQSMASTAEWMQLGFESSSISYAIRTQQGGAASNRPLILSATSNTNQVTLNTDGSVAFSANATFNGSLAISSTQDATSAVQYGSSALGIAGGLAVGKSVVVGTTIQSPNIQVTGSMDVNAAGSLDKVSLSYTTLGNINFYNNANTVVNIHTGNSMGPTNPNQEKLVVGFRDSTTHIICSTASGTGFTRDLTLQTGGNVNQMRLYAIDNSTRFAGDVHINSTTASTAAGSGALQIAGGLTAYGSATFLGGLVAGNGVAGNLLTLSGKSSWSFASIDVNNMYVQANGANSALSFTNANASVLLRIDATNNLTTSFCPLFVSNMSTKAMSVQNGSGIDLFMFDTVNHNFDVQNGSIINVASPQNPGDAVCKSYVDNLIKGLNLKAAAYCAATSNVDLTRPVAEFDDVTIAVGYRVLLMFQTNDVENGLYYVLANNMLARTNDLAAGSRAAGAFCFVETGTLRGDKGYVCIAVYPNDIVGTNALNFTQFNGNVISAGLGLYKDGNNYMNISLDPASGMSFNGNYLRIDPGFAGAGLQLTNGVISLEPISTLGTVFAGVWEAGIINTAYGGTGNSSFNDMGIVFARGTSQLSSSSSDLVWDYNTKALGINGLPNTNSANDGLTLISRDLCIQGVTSGLYIAGDDAYYNWGLRRSDAPPLSTLNFTAEPWNSIAMSKDGSVVILIAGPGNNSYISSDGGYTWTILIDDGNNHVFTECVLSYDGSVILIGANQDYLYVSIDGGSSFTASITDMTRVWEWTSISDNGQYMLASSLSDGCFSSNNSGQTWTCITNLPTDPDDLGFVHVCKDGSVQFAGYFGGPLFYSSNYGATFTQRSDLPSGNFYDMAEGRDSNALLLFQDTGYLYVSSDLGVTFAERLSDTPRQWVSGMVSPDGTTMVAAEGNGCVWLSTNYGTTWGTIFGALTANWTCVVIDQDDLGIFAAGTNVPVYITTDASKTYNTITSTSVDVPAMCISPNGDLYFPVYNAGVQRYLYNPSSDLVLSTGNSPVKSNLSDFVVFTGGQKVGIGYSAATSSNINSTLSINGTLLVQGATTLATALDVSSGGTGTSALQYGIVIANGTSPFTSTSALPNGAVPIGCSDGSGHVAIESGSTLRSHLGLAIGSQVQAWGANLDSIASLSPLQNYFIMGTGTGFTMGTAADAASSLGLGNLAYLNTVNNNYWSGTSLSVANGGTGATTFSAGTLPYYNGTSFANTNICYDSNNVGLCVNATSVPSGSALAVYGGDVSIVAQTTNSTPSSLLFHDIDSTVAWRIRRNDNGTGTGASNLVISGGIQSSNKNALLDRVTIMSTGEMAISTTTDSTNIGSGCLQLSGGLSIAKSTYVGGVVYIKNTADSVGGGSGALVVSGGASITDTLTVGNLTVNGFATFSSTEAATSAANAGTIFSGGIGIAGNIWNTGGINVQRSSAVGSRASGITVSYDGVAWTANTPVSDANRHLSLISNIASSGTIFSMRNLTSTNGWDIIVEGGGDNRLIFQSSPISTSTNPVTWMTIDSVTGTAMLTSTLDANATTDTAALAVSGGIYAAKSILAGNGIANVTNQNANSSITVSNSYAGTAAYSEFQLVNDSGIGAELFLNSSQRTNDGGPNTLTLRNDVGVTRVQAEGGLGLTLAANTGNATLDGTITISSTLDATSTGGGSATVLGGLTVAKSTYLAGNLTVGGTLSVAQSVSSPTLTTPSGDFVNVSSLSVFSTKLVSTNSQQNLYVNITVTPTAASLNTQFTFVLPGRITNFAQSLSMDNGQCSGFTDTTNMIVLQNILCTGVASSTKAIVKFQSVSTAVHYLQVFVTYAAS